MAAPAKSAKKDFDVAQLAKDLLAGGISGSLNPVSVLAPDPLTRPRPFFLLRASSLRHDRDCSSLRLFNACDDA
jgi:hypothetical protein